MDSNIAKLSLGSLLIIFLAISCKNKGRNDVKKIQIIADTCGPLFSMAGNNIRAIKGNDLESNLGCRNCHSPSTERNYPNLPTMYEISRMDSLQLGDFIFISKHKGYFRKEPALKYKIKTIDSLSDCDRKNLIHYIKDYDRPQLNILKTYPDSDHSSPKD